jgi:hypothetical protein
MVARLVTYSTLSIVIHSHIAILLFMYNHHLATIGATNLGFLAKCKDHDSNEQTTASSPREPQQNGHRMPLYLQTVIQYPQYGSNYHSYRSSECCALMKLLNVHISILMTLHLVLLHTLVDQWTSKITPNFNYPEKPFFHGDFFLVLFNHTMRFLDVFSKKNECGTN